MAETLVSTKVVTGLVRFSYLHVFEPHSVEEGQDKKYSASLIIPKSDKATIKKIETAVKAAIEVGKMKHFGGKTPAKLSLPLRDGDAEKPDEEAYKDCYFISAKSTSKPQIVDKNLNPIMDRDDIYSGCYGRASLNFFAFGKDRPLKGVACGLNNLQKMKDGEPLGGGRSKAEDDFSEAYELEDDDLL